MRYLGIDYGTKNMGISISDMTNTIASSLKVISYNNIEDVIKEISSLIQEYNITHIILGYPLNMNGSKSKTCEKIDEFIIKLKKNLNVKIDTIDERLTSVLANNLLISSDMSRKKRKKIVDKISASIILQSYLNRSKNE